MATDGRSVGARVRAARSWLAAARLAESALLAAAAFLALLAAAVLSGARPSSDAALTVAALGAVLAGAAHARFHYLSPALVARRLDDALGLDGALLTAWEVERAPAAPPLARLLPARVAACVPRRSAQRALLPRSLPLGALPFLAGAVLALALDARQRGDWRRTLEAHGARLVAGGSRLRAALGEEGAELEPEEVAELLALARSSAALDPRAPGEPELAGLELEELRARAAELAAELPYHSAARRELQAMEADAEAALRGLEASPSTRARANEADPAPGEEGSGAGAEAATPASADLTPSGVEGRMTDRPTPEQSFGPAPGDARTPAAAGLAGRGPLPPEHARIVARWLAAHAAPSPDPER